MSQYCLHLAARENLRQAFWPLCPDDPVKPGQINLENHFVKKQERSQRLVLGRGRHIALLRQVTQEGRHLAGAHVLRMAQFMIEDEAAHPMDISLLGLQAVMTYTQRLPQSRNQLWLLQRQLDRRLHDNDAPGSLRKTVEKLQCNYYGTIKACVLSDIAKFIGTIGRFIWTLPSYTDIHVG